MTYRGYSAEDNIAIVAANLAVSRAFCKLVQTRVLEPLSSLRTNSRSDKLHQHRPAASDKPQFKSHPREIPLDGMSRVLIKERPEPQTQESDEWEAIYGDNETSHSELRETLRNNFEAPERVLVE